MTTTTEPTKLPDTLHGLLTVALDDLKKVERSKRYDVDMGVWHCPDDLTGGCSVCAAGAVMAKTLGLGRGVATTPGLLLDDGLTDEDTCNKLRAINKLRGGEPSLAWDYLKGREPWDLGAGDNPYVNLDRCVPLYEVDRRGWWRAMRKLQRDLEEAGL